MNLKIQILIPIRNFKFSSQRATDGKNTYVLEY